MHSPSGQSEPPIQVVNDSSYHRTDFRGYTNRATHIQLSEGTMNIHQPWVSVQYDPSNPLHILQEHTSPRAEFNSAERFDAPRCADETRKEIIQRIEEWITDDASDASFFWLYGGAGVGKSAIAQTLAEKFDQKRELAASFFFRGDGSRNDGNNLIPTVVSQLVRAFDGLGPFVQESIKSNPDVFTKLYQVQIEELLVRPFHRLKPSLLSRIFRLKSKNATTSCPRLIIIDGLDECGQNVQCSLIRTIAKAIPRIPYPLRFLITSRPETHIVALFEHDQALQDIKPNWYNLSDDPNAGDDIRRFLEDEFGKIRRSHCLGPQLSAWPSEDYIALLVNRSSGHFIYAATVIRYIRSNGHRPDDRLKVILQRQPSQCQDNPYAELDVLYSLIFRGIENLEKVCLVLGILYIRDYTDLSRWAPYSNCSTIERILGLQAGDATLLLSSILSLVSIKDGDIKVLHKSLIDYLLYPTRCGHVPLPFDLARVHESAATHILQEKIEGNRCTISEFANFAYHCRNGYLRQESVKKYLHNLKVPYPDCVNTNLQEALLGTNRLNPLATVAHFFRALGRDDFDSTGMYHQKYVAEWMDYLQPSLPNLVTTVDKDSQDLKDKLDKMLLQWMPENFTSPHAGISTRHENLIVQEHRVWEALTRYRCSPSTTETILSSLVFGRDFIYSYQLSTEKRRTAGKNSSFLFLTVYARHENVSVNFDPQVTVASIDGVITDTLKLAEKFLLSDLYRKYGILPEGV